MDPFLFWSIYCSKKGMDQLKQKKVWINQDVIDGPHCNCMSPKLAQCLASYFRDPGKFSKFFSVVCQASNGKKLCEENHGTFQGTREFDATHSAIIFASFINLNPQNSYKNKWIYRL